MYMFIIYKYLLTALIIVVVSEVAKNNERVGALISSLPTITICVFFWLYFEGQSFQKIATHSFYTFWYVLPSLPLFLFVPYFLERGYSFFSTLCLGICLTFITFLIIAYIAKFFNVNLLP